MAVPKIKWRVAPEPTGRYRSFDKRGWPTASYPNGTCAGWIISTTEQRYLPSQARDGTHDPLKVLVADFSLGPQQRKMRTSKAEFKTVEEAKDALARILRANPQFLPEEYRNA